MSWHNYSLKIPQNSPKNRAFLNSTLYTYIVVMMGISPSLSGVPAVCLRFLDDDDMLDFFLVLVVATPTGVPALLCSSVLIPLIPGSVLTDTVVLESNTESSSIGGSSATVLRGMLDGGGWKFWPVFALARIWWTDVDRNSWLKDVPVPHTQLYIYEMLEEKVERNSQN